MRLELYGFLQYEMEVARHAQHDFLYLYYEVMEVEGRHDFLVHMMTVILHDQVEVGCHRGYQSLKDLNLYHLEGGMEVHGQDYMLVGYQN